MLAFALLLAAERLVVIVPYGKVNPDYVAAAEIAITSVADVNVRVDPQRALPKSAWYAPRKRWRAEKILDAIDAEVPEGAWKVVALTEAEISTTKGKYEDWGIVGLGSLDGTSCVVSSHIFKKHSKTKEALHRRLSDSVVHEFGHTLGLDHCPTTGCTMRDANGKAITSADTSTGRYCSLCRSLVDEDVLKPGED